MKCAACKGPVAGDGRTDVLRCACCLPGDPLEERAARGHAVFCSDQCSRQSTFRRRATHRRCAACGADFDPKQHDDRGRRIASFADGIYCTAACRQHVADTRALAAKELAKNEQGYKTASEALAASTRARDLFEHWAGRGVEKPDGVPEAGAITALRHRIEHLDRILEQLHAQEREATAVARQRAARKAADEQRAAAAAAADVWRKQLLKQ